MEQAVFATQTASVTAITVMQKIMERACKVSCFLLHCVYDENKHGPQGTVILKKCVVFLCFGFISPLSHLLCFIEDFLI